jgi:hypothetical protein
MLQQTIRGIRRAAVLGALLMACGLAMADDKQSTKDSRKATESDRASGVIAKIEPAERGDKDTKRAWKLTLNTDVVWRDFVRDQATDPAKAARTGIRKAAEKGKESVATEGHPKDDQLMVTVLLDPETEITMRYRSSTDAIGEGSVTPGGASKAEAANDNEGDRKGSAEADRSDSKTKRQALKARSLEARELKPGLWVEVDFRHGDKQNKARRVMVMRPVGGPDTSPDKEKGTSTPTSNPGR